VTEAFLPTPRRPLSADRNDFAGHRFKVSENRRRMVPGHFRIIADSVGAAAVSRATYDRRSTRCFIHIGGRRNRATVNTKLHHLRRSYRSIARGLCNVTKFSNCLVFEHVAVVVLGAPLLAGSPSCSGRSGLVSPRQGFASRTRADLGLPRCGGRRLRICTHTLLPGCKPSHVRT